MDHNLIKIVCKEGSVMVRRSILDFCLVWGEIFEDDTEIID
jgi:hypothetical protein